MLVRLHHSLICLLHPARYTRALRCAHWYTHLLHSLPRSWDSDWLDGYSFCVFSILAHSAMGTWWKKLQIVIQNKWRFFPLHASFYPHINPPPPRKYGFRPTLLHSWLCLLYIFLVFVCLWRSIVWYCMVLYGISLFNSYRRLFMVRPYLSWKKSSCGILVFNKTE